MRINRFFLAVTLLLLGAGGGQGKSLTPQQLEEDSLRYELLKVEEDILRYKLLKVEEDSPRYKLLKIKEDIFHYKLLILKLCRTLERVKKTQAQLDSVNVILGRVREQLKELEVAATQVPKKMGGVSRGGIKTERRGP